MIKSLIDLCCTISVDYENQKVSFQIRRNKVEIFGNKEFRPIPNQGKQFVIFMFSLLFIRSPQPHRLPPAPHPHLHPRHPRRDIVQVLPPLNR